MLKFRAAAALTSIPLFVLALSLSAGAQSTPLCQTSGLVTTETDRFSGKTSINTVYKPRFELGRLFPLMGADFNGKRLLIAQLILSGGFDGGWHYLKCHDTYILVDGNRVTTGRVVHDGNVVTGDTVTESIMVNLDAQAISQLERANKIEFKVCMTEFEADSNFVCAARLWACRVKEQLSGTSQRCEPAAPKGAPTGAPAAVSVEPATVAPAQSPGFQRVAVAGTSLSYPYTVEIPSDWQVHQVEVPKPTLLLAPPAVMHPNQSDIIGVVACLQSLANPDQVIANVKRTLKGVRTAVVKEIDGVRGVLAEWDEGDGATVLSLMLPTSTGCVQFLGRSPRSQFEADRAKYERIIFSVRRTP
jgi:hypothetical protein